MADYIKREDAIALLGKNWRIESDANDAIQKTIEQFANIPAADVVDRKALLDALYAEDAITMRGVSIINNFAKDTNVPVKCEDCRHGAHFDGVVICDKDAQRHERTDGCERGERK